MNLQGGIILAFTLLLAGCAHLKATEELLVLRVTWEQPARQAGVYDEAQQAVESIDRAILTGDPKRVRAAIMALEQPYRELRAEIERPTAEQAAFDERVLRLWDAVNDPGVDWIGAGLVIVRTMARVL